MSRIVTLLVAALLVCYGAAGAKRAEKKVPPGDTKGEVQGQAEQFKNKIKFCRQLMREKNYEGASALLETLYEERPDNSQVVNLLRQCYDKLQLFSKSEELTRRHVERYPTNLSFRLSYAEALARQGKTKQASVVYDTAAFLIKDRNITRFELVVRSMIANSLDEKALSLIDELRQEKNESTLFALYRGTILEKQKEYRQAALEFYSLLPDTTNSGRSAEKKIAEMLGFVESSPDVEKALLKRPDLFTTARALKILSAHYLRTGQYQKAFDFTITRDSIEGFKGQTLVAFMRNCMERKLYSQAARMGEYVLRHYGDVPAVSEAHFIYAGALSRLGRQDEAIATYDSIVANFVLVQDKALALYRIGQIHLNRLNNYERALECFDSVVVHYPGGLGYMNALIGIPYCYLRLGELAQSKAHFQQLSRRRLVEDIKEEIAYNLALILFLEKKIDSSQAAFRKLVVDYPRGYYVNDALQLMMTIEEAKAYPHLLYDYSNVLLFEQRRMTDSTIARLNSIAETDSLVLADVALFKLAEISLSRSDSADAIGYIDQLAERFPDSYYLPYGLKKKADIFSLDEEKTDLARQIYRSLLENHPNYPFISEVRQKMRKLEAEPGSA